MQFEARAWTRQTKNREELQFASLHFVFLWIRNNNTMMQFNIFLVSEPPRRVVSNNCHAFFSCAKKRCHPHSVLFYYVICFPHSWFRCIKTYTYLGTERSRNIYPKSIWNQRNWLLRNGKWEKILNRGYTLLPFVWLKTVQCNLRD